MSSSNKPKCRFTNQLCNLDQLMQFEGNACVNRNCARGKSFRDTLTSAYHLRPPIQTNLEKYLEFSKEKNFRSTKYPLGGRKTVNPHVPKDLDTTNTRFGVVSHRGKSIWPHLRPPYTQAQVMEAAMKDKDFPGRQTKRGFKIDLNARFGVKSSSSKETVDQLLHTYFEITPPRELVGMVNRQEASGDLRVDIDLAKVAHVRNHLKRALAHNFDNAKQAFDFFDKKEQGFIDVESLNETLRQFNIRLSSKHLKLLIKECKGKKRPKIEVKNPKTYKYGKDCCKGEEKKCVIIEDEEDICETKKEVVDTNYKEDVITYEEFVIFLTFFKKDQDTGVKFPKLIKKDLNVELKESIYKNDYIPFRKPEETITHGLRSPMLKEVEANDIKLALSTDRIKYCLNPSIFDDLGINKDDLKKLRTKEHIRLIFYPYFDDHKDDENFECLYKIVSSDNDCGMTSVQKFKEILDSHLYNL